MSASEINVILEFNMYSKDRKEGLDYFKIYQSNMIPRIGAKVMDPLFAVSKKVVDVIYNYSQNEVRVILESKELKDEVLNGHVQEVTELHGWNPIESKEE
jgi:hypothetical protein